MQSENRPINFKASTSPKRKALASDLKIAEGGGDAGIADFDAYDSPFSPFAKKFK